MNRFILCKFEGPPPPSFISWKQWRLSRLKKGVSIRCLTEEDLANASEEMDKSTFKNFQSIINANHEWHIRLAWDELIGDYGTGGTKNIMAIEHHVRGLMNR